MTVEEALLAGIGLIALVLLFLGLVDALEGDPRAWLRRRRRAQRARSAAGPASAAPAPRLRRLAAASPPAREPGPEAKPPEAARETATEQWRDRVAALIQGRELGQARQLLEPAIAEGEVGPETTAFLLGIASAAMARDLSRLRRARRRGGGEEAPLAASLQLTGLLLGAPGAQALPPEQQRRLRGRLWRGHARLGVRRWRAGDFEAAVEALFQAIGMPELDERRRRLVRDLLVRALEDMAGQSLELIPQLLGEGDRAAALEQAQRLLTHIHRAREEGLPAEDLAVAASRARQLLAHIEQAPVQ